MYRLSARQILLIAIISGLFAAGAVAICRSHIKSTSGIPGCVIDSGSSRVTDPSVATDEQNNIEVYKALGRCVFIHSTSYARDWLGFVEPQEVPAQVPYSISRETY
jgi:hypothetical protein